MPGVEIARRFHLFGREARVVLALGGTLNLRGIELAGARVRDDAVDEPIAAVALGERRVVDVLDLCGSHCRAVTQEDLVAPDRRRLRGEGVHGRAGDYAVVVLRV